MYIAYIGNKRPTNFYLYEKKNNFTMYSRDIIVPTMGRLNVHNIFIIY